MTDFDNLDEKLRAAGGPIEMIRHNESRPLSLPVLPNVYTNWFDEQRAWRESCAFFDQSHHMYDVIVEGPDALDVFSDLGVNSFEGFEAGKAKQFLMCNPEGYYIGDGILSHVQPGRYRLVAPGMGPHWIEYNLEQGSYDVEVEIDPNDRGRDGPPKSYRFELMGPNTIDIMDAIADEPTSDIAFFNLDRISIAGCDVYALQHSMGGEGGIELWGPWEDHERVENAIFEAGREYGLRRLGTMTYRSTACFSGWVHFPLPAVYDESMQEYREWLSAEGFEGNISLSGSYYSDDVRDYYLTPVDVGLERLVSFDHEFVGREAIETHLDESSRQLVMLEWGGDDAVDVYSTLFDTGDTFKFIELLDPSWGGAHYDEVRVDGELRGLSKWPAYNTNERGIFSLAIVDEELAIPGTGVTLRWGIPEGKPLPDNVEEHIQTDIRATVRDVEMFRDQHR